MSRSDLQSGVGNAATRREFRFWRSWISLTAATDGNPVVWLRLGSFGIGIGRLEGTGWPTPIWWQNHERDAKAPPLPEASDGPYETVRRG